MTHSPRTTKIPATICPSCGWKNDAATHPTEDVAPTPGDLSVCLRCQEIMRFDDGLQLVKPTGQELNDMYRQQPGLRAELFKMQRAAARAMDKGTPNE